MGLVDIINIIDGYYHGAASRHLLIGGLVGVGLLFWCYAHERNIKHIIADLEKDIATYEKKRCDIIKTH